MDRKEELPWVQVIGKILVHRPGRSAHEPTGSSRLLLCILVAAGPDGASLEDIANAYWRQARPSSWMVALRVSASHLNAQLPDGWSVETCDSDLRLAPGRGFIDIWRVDALDDDPSKSEPILDWLAPGVPFAGVDGIDLVDSVARRLTPKVKDLAAQDPPTRQVTSPLSTFPRDETERTQWVQGLRRAIVVSTPQNHQLMASTTAGDGATQTLVIVGDRGLLLPLGPFAMTFPALRNQLRLEQGLVDAATIERAFRVVTTMLSVQAQQRPQRLLVANAPQLDTTSLKLVSMLIDRGRLSDFSLIMCADPADCDVRWLDFVHRSVTAGCGLIEFASD